MLKRDFEYCMSADGLVGHSLSNWIRTKRRMWNRCCWERDLIQRTRVFCQNSGACGSSYIIQLLQDNLVERCFHELEPDFNELGIEHYENGISKMRLVRLLRYTRHDVFFEANNRLFSLSQALKSAFPQSRFIHLHRHPAEAIRSAMSKPDIKTYLEQGLRFQGTLAGCQSSSPFERICHYWASVNNRIVDDLRGFEFLSLRFDDLISGNIGDLESFLNIDLPIRRRSVVNAGRIRIEGRFPDFLDWDRAQKISFEQICGPLMNQLGYTLWPGKLFEQKEIPSSVPPGSDV